MMPSPRSEPAVTSEHPPQLQPGVTKSSSSTATTSPVDQSSSNPSRVSFTSSSSLPSHPTAQPGSSRLGTASPSHDGGAVRPFSKRAREIQASEGLSMPFWGPPASGGSTPLREVIPESPSQDGFPDFMTSDTDPISSAIPPAGRRPRAGTVPSRFAPSQPPGLVPAPSGPASISRHGSSTSPFKMSSYFNPEIQNSTSTLLSRLRAGSLPQQNILTGGSRAEAAEGPSTAQYDPSRLRSSTLASIQSGEATHRPRFSSLSREALNDGDVRTLDYLGLADGSRQVSLTNNAVNTQNFLPDFTAMNRNLNRIRSYSVNAQESYRGPEGTNYTVDNSNTDSGIVTPVDAALAQTRAQIHHHNLAVQAFASQASASRPRAQTAGVLDSPLRSTPVPLRYAAMTNRPRQLSNAVPFDWSEEELSESLQTKLSLASQQGRTQMNAEENGMDMPTRALWLGNVPSSTTTSSLEAIFGVFGAIESSRVLVHKNCAFVNFESDENARLARSTLNGKEIFPGAGPSRIGFAKAPSSLETNITSRGNARSLSPLTSAQSDRAKSHHEFEVNAGNADLPPRSTTPIGNRFALPTLQDSKDAIMQMVREFGASPEETQNAEHTMQAALDFTAYQDTITPVTDNDAIKIFDAPRLREIRKQMDNDVLSRSEVEQLAIEMLPELCQLASNYLGNTVVQKLFEVCSEDVKEKMLQKIAPVLAQVGTHKNGTWAAQKIIEVTRSPQQMKLIAEHIRPYTVPLFLDQYGNYVLQGCLRFGAPYNEFIFEAMTARIWDIAQGRFGARAMRACLESQYASRSMQYLVAGVIVMHTVQLAVDSNGALLSTWLLDTCTFPNRRLAIALQLKPYLSLLSTHKIANLTVLKILSQQNEISARNLLAAAIFEERDGQVLEEILRDTMYGATFIFKALTAPGFDEARHQELSQKVKAVLVRTQTCQTQANKRLMDEVGLAGRTPRDHSTSSYWPKTIGGARERGTPLAQEVQNGMRTTFMPSTSTDIFAMPSTLSRQGPNSHADPAQYAPLGPMYAHAESPPMNNYGYSASPLSRNSTQPPYYSSFSTSPYQNTSPLHMGQVPARAMHLPSGPVATHSSFGQSSFGNAMGLNAPTTFQQFQAQYVKPQPPMMMNGRSPRAGPYP